MIMLLFPSITSVPNKILKQDFVEYAVEFRVLSAEMIWSKLYTSQNTREHKSDTGLYRHLRAEKAISPLKFTKWHKIC